MIFILTALKASVEFNQIILILHTRIFFTILLDDRNETSHPGIGDTAQPKGETLVSSCLLVLGVLR